MAAAYCEKALEISSKLGDKLVTADAYKLEGVICRKKKEWDGARRFFEESIRINKGRNCPLDEAETYYEYGLVYDDKGETEEALKWFRESLNIFKRLNARKDIKRVSDAISKTERSAP